MKTSPWGSSTRVGVMQDRCRLPGWTELAEPGVGTKSSMWVLRMKPNGEIAPADRRRHQGRFRHLELICADILGPDGRFPPVDLVFAGLLFEYVDFSLGLARIKQLLNPSGHLGVVLQLPSLAMAEVTPTPYTSLGRLSGFMALVPPDRLEAGAGALGFTTMASATTTLASGKAFHEFVFREAGD